MRLTDVPKRAKNSIEANLKKSIRKYGYIETRCVIMRYFENQWQRQKLEAKILEAEEKLAELKKSKK